jgi:hypothetical protein
MSWQVSYVDKGRGGPSLVSSIVFFGVAAETPEVQGGDLSPQLGGGSGLFP